MIALGVFFLFLIILPECLPHGANHFAQTKIVGPDHKHSSRADMLSEIAPEVSILRVEPLQTVARENFCKTKDKRFIAYTTSAGSERLFINDTRKRVVYEVRGLPMEHRPFSDLRWSTQQRLEFDRWSQPHHGMHYELDMRRRRLVVVYAFPD
jgi:hypothetical protein